MVAGVGALVTTVTPIGAFAVASRTDALELTAYWVSGLILSGLIASLLAARRRAEAAREQVAFLAEVSEVLASSLDYRATLSAAARLAVPRLADWCAVDVVDADGRLRRLAIAHADPAKVDAVWAMSHRYREAGRGSGAAGDPIGAAAAHSATSPTSCCAASPATTSTWRRSAPSGCGPC